MGIIYYSQFWETKSKQLLVLHSDSIEKVETKLKRGVGKLQLFQPQKLKI